MKYSLIDMIAVVSDIHSNLEAFTKVLREIEKKKCSIVFNAGDTAGYYTRPDECVNILRKRKIVSVMGNHDNALLQKDFETLGPVASESLKWQRKRLSKTNLKFLSSFPKILDREIRERKITMVHGSPSDPLGDYVFPWTPEHVFEEFLEKTGAEILIMGHSHVPFVKKISDKLVLNPGSVGQPRDGNPKASFALADTQKMKATIKRVEYDVFKACDDVADSGLPVFLAERLLQGI